ncbi:hypothetical protein L6452_06987 [Arctium lappa]|uniref:Uncharacterized protein n=1 Tax=Arctium lappa TaxID=4217 RepID=A0ACB9EL44_ARCLA|nr:hypothetical protein L6452_06987 [Arctium lappa]
MRQFLHPMTLRAAFSSNQPAADRSSIMYLLQWVLVFGIDLLQWGRFKKTYFSMNFMLSVKGVVVVGDRWEGNKDRRRGRGPVEEYVTRDGECPVVFVKDAEVPDLVSVPRLFLAAGNPNLFLVADLLLAAGLLFLAVDQFAEDHSESCALLFQRFKSNYIWDDDIDGLVRTS